MSRANVEVVRRLLAAYERGDLAAVYAAYHPDIEWHVARLGARQLGFDRVYRGREGVREFFRQWIAGWETIEFDYEEMLDAGEHVVVVLSQRMRGRTSGVELDWRSYAQVWTLRDGLVVRSEFFPTRAEALEAVGLR